MFDFAADARDVYKRQVNSRAEELFVHLFCEAFGSEKTENLQVQYPCVDIYGRHRYIEMCIRDRAYTER